MLKKVANRKTASKVCNHMYVSPFFIGPVQIRNRCILAPMSGISDLPFRRLAWRYGAGLVVTEMVASREFVCDSAESRVRAMGDGIRPHIVQLAGREPQWMSEAARLAEANGADIIDINMGCPAKKVTGGYSGSALMRDEDRALSLIEATVAAVRIPVTLKMRLGWDNQNINAPDLAASAESAGVQAITVHGRTRNQFYEGKADWHAIARVRERISIPLISNGDVESREDVAAIVAASGADAVMIGRAARGRPWHVGWLAGNREIPDTYRAILNVVHEHYQASLLHYGRNVGFRQFRKHLGWYLDRNAVSPSRTLRCSILSETCPDRVMELFSQALSPSGSAQKPISEAA
jgi:tRNA-dihydrouridine synthase B